MRAARLREAAAGQPQYERRRPEQTPLYRLVREHYQSFAAEVEHATGAQLPQFIKDEFTAYLDCGILAHGFLRLTCEGCARDTLVAFSCKRRGICPSCGTRRMAETAADLVDNILPQVAVRQWVLSFPIPLRSLFAVHPERITPVLHIIHRTINTHLIKQAGIERQHAHTGAITLIQRFGSAANLNTHLHALVLDGVYRTDSTNSASENALPLFVETPAPSTWRIAQGPRAGRKVLTLVDGAKPPQSRDRGPHDTLCANAQGFSLHAGVRCEAKDRQGIEQLCRYITRPAISNERLGINRVGNIVLKLKTAWRNGTTHIVLAPMEFMQRLAALIPRPRLHLIRFHGVLAPNARFRSQVVPTPAQQTTTGEGNCNHEHSKPVRMTWARLLKRVFDMDIEQCAYGGKLKLVAIIEEPTVIEKILKHIGLDPPPPPIAPARRRTELFEWASAFFAVPSKSTRQREVT